MRRRLTLRELIDRLTPLAEQAARERAAANLKTRRFYQRRLTKIHERNRRRKILEKRRGYVPGPGKGSGPRGADGRFVRKPERPVKLRPARTLYGMPGWQVMAARMDPAVWYSVRELGALVPEFAYSSVKGWLGNGKARGVIDRAPNADYDATRPSRTQTEPQWLWRVAGNALGRVEGWREVLRAVE